MNFSQGYCVGEILLYNVNIPMSDPAQETAPTCTRCGRIFVEGTGGVCAACRQTTRRSGMPRGNRKRKREIRLTCQCGSRAVTVLNVRVGRQFDGFYTVRMPLCRTCLEIEKAMWGENGNKLDG